MTRDSRGFALLAVLWALAGVVVTGAVAATSGRAALAAARNRVALVRAGWLAEGCVERALAVIGVAAALREPSGGVPWSDLDQTTRNQPWPADCRLDVIPAGQVLDANAATREQLVRLFDAVRLLPAQADSLADALLDWRDADSLSRPHGAERKWYRDRSRFPPRDGPLADAREIRRVRGFDLLPELDSLLGIGDRRVALHHARLPVLASLPGFGHEALALAADLRRQGIRTGDLISFASGLAVPAREALLARAGELATLLTPEPEAWIITARGRAGNPALEAVMEVRLVRSGPGVVVVRRRVWP